MLFFLLAFGLLWFAEMLTFPLRILSLAMRLPFVPLTIAPVRLIVLEPMVFVLTVFSIKAVS